ncbi:MAG: Npt1/Npt2 family nucleotide transporter [Roseivirga sp.]
MLPTAHTMKRSRKGNHFLLLMSSFMFLILFLANTLRVLKESLLVTHMGIESLSYIRILLHLPCSLLIIWIVTRLKKRYSQQHTFNLVIGFYLVFITAFVSILYPYQEALRLPVGLKTYALQVLPAATRLVTVIDCWPITLLYLLADLWPLLIYVNCFWALSNQLVDTEEAARIYPLYNVLGQANILFTGVVLYYLSECAIKQYAGRWSFDFTQWVGTMVLLGMVVVLLLYNYIIACYKPPHTAEDEAQGAQRLSFRQTLQLLWRHQHIANIFLCTLLYYAVICSVETLWLHTIAIHYITPSLVGRYQAQTLLLIGSSTLSFALIGKRLLSHLGWYWVLQILPGTMLLFSLVMIGYTGILSMHESWVALYLSTSMYTLAKSMKYTFFDVTKEMAYIPTEDHIKFYGKLSADTLANSLGKITGNLFPIIFFTLYWEASFDQLTALSLAVLVLLLSSFWLAIARQLKKSYHHLLRDQTSMSI